MATKLTTAQQKAWELIKSELSLSAEERRAHGIFSTPWGKPGTFTLATRKAIMTTNTLRTLRDAGLIEITDTFYHRPYFRLTDAGKAEMAESAPEPEPMPKPTTGTLYERPLNDGIKALVIDAIRPLDGGWLCTALLLQPCCDDAATVLQPIAVQQIVLTCDDRAQHAAPLTVAEGLAQLRQMQITRKLAEREAQREAFQKTLEGRAASSYTDAEYAEAKRLHIVLQDYKTGCKGWDAPLRLVLPGMTVNNGR